MAAPPPLLPVSPSAKSASHWFTQPWKAIQIPFPRSTSCVTVAKSRNLSEPGVPALGHRGAVAPLSEVVGGRLYDARRIVDTRGEGALARPEIRMDIDRRQQCPKQW